MGEEKKKSSLRMIEEAFANPKKKKILNVFIDGKGGDVYAERLSEETAFLHLSKFTIHALELRPKTISLPIGDYELIRDHITSHAGEYTRITDYIRVNK